MTSIFRKEKKYAKTLKFSNGQNMWKYNMNLVMVGNSQGKNRTRIKQEWQSEIWAEKKVAVAYFFSMTRNLKNAAALANETFFFFFFLKSHEYYQVQTS